MARICERIGQRSFIGKVNMDREAPDFYVESTEESLTETERFIEEILSMKSPLITPIITPRFVITCTERLMTGLSQLATKYNLPIQSHVSENTGEVQFVKQLFPNEKSYTNVYDTHGLLTDRTIMAHGIFLTDDEMKLLSDKKSTISHCPLSNFSLKSGMLDVRRALKFGVNVGLGTDVSGGYAPSMLNAIRTTIIASTGMMSSYHHDYSNIDQMINNESFAGHPSNQDEYERYETLNTCEALYLATMGGAKSLGLEERIGNFESGKAFDALLVDVDVENGPIDPFLTEYELIYDHQQLSENERVYKRLLALFERFIYNGDDRNISSVFVQGVNRL